MGCGCNKKQASIAPQQGPTEKLGDPVEWGPILWKYLHCMAEKIGKSGNPIIDSDQATIIHQMITLLPTILPCTECQEHSKQYLDANPLQPLTGLRDEALQSTVRQWLVQFHNSVRQRKGQPIMTVSEQQCIELYKGCFIAKCEYNQFIKHVAYATQQRWVKVDAWKKWFQYSERMRLLLGTLIG